MNFVPNSLPVMRRLLLALLGLCAAAARADDMPADWSQQVRQLTLAATRDAAPGTRVEVEVGRLDPRLRLAPCDKIEPYLPPGARAWGPTRVGLRCVQGAVAWNVYMPVTVKVLAPSLVAARALPPGTVLEAADLMRAEVDLAASPSPAVGQADAAVGRMLARRLDAGAALRSADLKQRQWFAAGDTVRIVAVGAGYAVSAEGQALAPGLEGQSVRVRTEAGRVISGRPVGDRQVEVAL